MHAAIGQRDAPRVSLHYQASPLGILPIASRPRRTNTTGRLSTTGTRPMSSIAPSADSN